MHDLLKTEPGVYSIDDLKREDETVWDGVSNPTAVKNLREMKPGEKLIIYHTGDEKQAVGTAKVLSVDTSSKAPVVRIKFEKKLKEPRTLQQIKAEKVFAESPLVRIGRLSVVPLTDAQWNWLVGG